MNPLNPEGRPDTRADDAHDAWLDHALRHAPDAGADAPAALSDAILRSARSAVARPVDAVAAPAAPAAATAATAALAAPGALRRRSRSHPWLSAGAWAWAWIARPPVAAGFGSVMVATLVGVLWWGRPLDEALPGEPVAAPAPAPASASASGRQATVNPAPATAVISAPVTRPTATPAPATPLPPTSSTKQADKAVPRVPQAARAARLEATPQAADNEAAAPSTLQVPAPAASPALPASETTPAAAPPLLDQRKRASGAPTDAALARAITAAESARSGPLQANAGPNAATSALAMVRPADAGRAPLGGLLTAVLREPDRWRWQRDTGGVETQAMTPNLQRWLAEAERATASQWRPGSAGVAPVGPPSLRLLRDGVLQATLSFGHGGLIETAGDAAPKTSTAALAPAVLEALAKALEEATR